MHTFNTKNYISFQYPWIDVLDLSQPFNSIEGLQFKSPSKWNSYEDFNLQHWMEIREIVTRSVQNDRKSKAWSLFQKLCTARQLGRKGDQNAWPRFRNEVAKHFISLPASKLTKVLSLFRCLIWGQIQPLQNAYAHVVESAGLPKLPEHS